MTVQSRLPSEAARSGLSFAKSFYFFYFAALGSLVPFLTLYYRERGLSGAQIGLLLGIQPLIALVSGPIWSGVADVTRQHKRLLVSSLLGLTVSVVLLSLSSSFLLFLPTLILF